LYYTASGIITLCGRPSGMQVRYATYTPDGRPHSVMLPDAV